MAQERDCGGYLQFSPSAFCMSCFLTPLSDNPCSFWRMSEVDVHTLLYSEILIDPRGGRNSNQKHSRLLEWDVHNILLPSSVVVPYWMRSLLLQGRQSERKEREMKTKKPVLVFWVSECSLFSSFSFFKRVYFTIGKTQWLCYFSKALEGETPQAGSWHQDTCVLYHSFSHGRKGSQVSSWLWNRKRRCMHEHLDHLCVLLTAIQMRNLRCLAEPGRVGTDWASVWFGPQSLWSQLLENRTFGSTLHSWEAAVPAPCGERLLETFSGEPGLWCLLPSLLWVSPSIPVLSIISRSLLGLARCIVASCQIREDLGTNTC